MFSTKVSNFHEVFKPLHICSQLIGLTGFTIITEYNAGLFEARVKFYNIVILFVATLMDFALLLIVIVDRDNMFGAEANPFVHSKQVTSGFKIVLSCFVALMNAVSFYTLYRRRNLVKLLNAMTEVDASLKFNVKIHQINYRKHKNNVVLALLSILFMLVLSYVSHFYLKKRYNMTYTNLFPIFITKSAAVYFFIYFQFVFFIATIQSRYRYVNSMLHIDMVGKVFKQKFNNKMIEIARVHDKLVDATHYMNQFYGFPVSC